MFPSADAIVVDSSKAQMFHAPEEEKRLLIAGCDPGISLVAQQLDFVIAPCTSRQALRWLKQGKAHVAGTHLRDSATGDYKIPILKHLFPAATVIVVTFAIWEQGLILSAGSQIGGIEDVSRKDVRIINREKERAAATFSISTSTPPASLPMA